MVEIKVPATVLVLCLAEGFSGLQRAGRQWVLEGAHGRWKWAAVVHRRCWCGGVSVQYTL